MSGATLTPVVAAWLLFGTFFVLLVLRVPVAFALGLACLPVLFIEPRLSPMVVFNTTFKAYNSFILLAPVILSKALSLLCALRALCSEIGFQVKLIAFRSEALFTFSLEIVM